MGIAPAYNSIFTSSPVPLYSSLPLFPLTRSLHLTTLIHTQQQQQSNQHINKGNNSRPPTRRSRRLRWLFGLTGLLGGGLWYEFSFKAPKTIDEHAPSKAPYDIAVGLYRLTRILACAIIMTLDYEYTFRLYGSNESEKSSCHWRNAKRLRETMLALGGVYIKFGQHVTQLEFLLPHQYVTAMQPLLNRTNISNYKEIKQLFMEELGKAPEEIFAEFNANPVASASLAQVHQARLHSGELVAVKIQHPHIISSGNADIAIVTTLLDWIYRIEPKVDYRWLGREMSHNLPLECDFTHEAHNAEITANNFYNHQSLLCIPKIYWPCTTKRVLTMEWVEGIPVTSVAELQEAGIDKTLLSHTISEIFNQMIFVHGFVHADPHEQNLLVRTRNRYDPRPQLVLLDHGLYRPIAHSFRLVYADLWLSIILGDEQGIKRSATAMGLGDQYQLLAAVLTKKPFDEIVSNNRQLDLKMKGTPQERAQLQQWTIQYRDEVQELLARLPRPFILLLKTLDHLRNIDMKLGCPMNSFANMMKYCNREIMKEKRKVINKHSIDLYDSSYPLISVLMSVFSLFIAYEFS